MSKKVSKRERVGSTNWKRGLESAPPEICCRFDDGILAEQPGRAAPRSGPRLAPGGLASPARSVPENVRRFSSSVPLRAARPCIEHPPEAQGRTQRGQAGRLRLPPARCSASASERCSHKAGIPNNAYFPCVFLVGAT